MASESQKSEQFNLEWNDCDNEFLEDIDFHLVESLMEKKISNLQRDVLVPKNTMAPLTTGENMMLRGDSRSTTNLSSDSVPQPLCQSSESSRILSSSLFDIAILFLSIKIRTLSIKQLNISISFTPRVKSGIFGQTAKFGQRPCLFHILNIGIKNKLTNQTVKILM